MDLTTHSVRLGIRGEEIEYRLTDEAIVWDEAGHESALPFSDIKQVHLKTFQADAMVDASDLHGRTTIEPKSGKRLIVGSHHCKGLGSYENRAASYASFVRELCKRVANANPATNFVRGSSPIRTIYLMVLCVLVIVGLAAGFVLIAKGEITGAVFVGFLLATVTPLAWFGYRSSRPDTFDAIDPPAELLEL